MPKAIPVQAKQARGSIKRKRVNSLQRVGQFVRPDRVMVVQSSPTGNMLIVMEGGTVVNSSESKAESS
jgi:hypothetical protein